jgi:hypothetical protein
MSKPKKQHYIPKFYLVGFVDPKTSAGEEPYVWIFKKGEKKGKKKAPSNIFTKTDLYTIKLKSGEKDYSIEEALSSLEGRYAGIFRNKISKHLALNDEEHLYLCAFVSAMLQRTLRHKENLERFYNELIARSEAMEQANGGSSQMSDELKEYKQNVHKLGLVQLFPNITELLSKMSIAFLVAEGQARFITSDDPCNLFNPDLQWQRAYGAGLGQKNVQVTLPLSPKILLCLSWSNLKGYISIGNLQVQDLNRMILNHCHEHFISQSPKTKWIWFMRYPLDFFFLLKILNHKIRLIWNKLRYAIRRGK